MRFVDKSGMNSSLKITPPVFFLRFFKGKVGYNAQQVDERFAKKRFKVNWFCVKIVFLYAIYTVLFKKIFFLRELRIQNTNRLRIYSSSMTHLSKGKGVGTYVMFEKSNWFGRVG